MKWGNTTDPDAIKRIIRNNIILMYLPTKKKWTVCLELQTTTTQDAIDDLKRFLTIERWVGSSGVVTEDQCQGPL